MAHKGCVVARAMLLMLLLVLSSIFVDARHPPTSSTPVVRSPYPLAGHKDMGYHPQGEILN